MKSISFCLFACALGLAWNLEAHAQRQSQSQFGTDYSYGRALQVGKVYTFSGSAGLNRPILGRHIPQDANCFQSIVEKLKPQQLQFEQTFKGYSFYQSARINFFSVVGPSVTQGAKYIIEVIFQSPKPRPGVRNQIEVWHGLGYLRGSSCRAADFKHTNWYVDDGM